MQFDLERERAWWDSKADNEEKDLGDEAVNRRLRWRAIERLLPGVQTVLEIGAATGVFSIPLAKRGFHVTHVDFSAEMLRIARQKARGIDNIHFLQANAADLSQFSDQAFDLVMNMDGAISFSGSEANNVLRESCRLAAKKLLVTVSHRAQLADVWTSEALALTGHFPRAVYAMLQHGEWHLDQYPENERLAWGYFGAIQAFLPAELRQIIDGMGLHVLRCGGLGSLAKLCGPDVVQQALSDESLAEEFLDICDYYDAHILPDGPGTRHRAGLIAIAERP